MTQLKIAVAARYWGRDYLRLRWWDKIGARVARRLGWIGFKTKP